jgi:hypothetical protein
MTKTMHLGDNGNVHTHSEHSTVLVQGTMYQFDNTDDNGQTPAAYLVVGICEKAEDCSFTRPQGLHMDHGTSSSLLKGSV